MNWLLLSHRKSSGSCGFLDEANLGQKITLINKVWFLSANCVQPHLDQRVLWVSSAYIVFLLYCLLNLLWKSICSPWDYNKENNPNQLGNITDTFYGIYPAVKPCCARRNTWRGFCRKTQFWDHWPLICDFSLVT